MKGRVLNVKTSKSFEPVGAILLGKVAILPESLTVIYSRLGSSAGAEGTLGDFCKATLENGHRCDVVIGRSTLRQRRRLRRSLRAFVMRRGQLTVVGSSRLIDFRVSRSVRISDFVQKPSLPLTSLRFLLNPSRLRTRRVLARSTSLLIGHVLTERGDTELRDLCPSTYMFLNHNGEPQDFYSDWKSRADKGKMEMSVGDEGSLYAKYLSRYRRILFQSEGQQTTFGDLFPEVTVETSVLWPSCDESNVSRQGTLRSALPPNKFNIVCVAKFQDKKGQLELLKALTSLLPRFPDAHLNFVGGSIADRTYVNRCIAYIQENEIGQSVSLFGQRKDAATFIAHCDLFALTSGGEGVSRAIREAAFLGKPILTTRLDGSESFLTSEGAFYSISQSPLDIVVAMEEAMGDLQERDRRARVGSARYQALSQWKLFRYATESLFVRPELPEVAPTHHPSWPAW